MDLRVHVWHVCMFARWRKPRKPRVLHQYQCESTEKEADANHEMIMDDHV